MDLESGFDFRAFKAFTLGENVVILFTRKDSYTPCKNITPYVASSFEPDVALIEIRTNYLSTSRLETVGSGIEKFVRLLLKIFSVKVVGMC